MTTSHPITAGTPEGSSSGAIGMVPSTNGAQEMFCLGQRKALESQKGIKLQAALVAASNYLKKTFFSIGKFRLQFRAKHLHQEGGTPLEEVHRESVVGNVQLDEARVTFVSDNAASGRRVTRDWQRSLPTKLLRVFLAPQACL